MAAQTADRATPRRTGDDMSLPVAAATKIFAGSIVCVNAGGFATKGAVSTTLKAVGVAEAQVDNSAGANGDLQVPVSRGVWRFGNSSSTDQITLADIGSSCFIVDDQTVAKTNGGATRSAAGTVADVDAQGVWVRFA